MWLGILLTLVFFIGFARIMVEADAQIIRDKWADYRCSPYVMMFASLFKNKDDPRSDVQYAADNFDFCVSEAAKASLTVALKPIMDVFYQMANAAMQSIGFTMNLRTLGANLFHGLTRMFSIFTSRFNLTIHEIHMSFLKQFSAIQKAQAIAVGTVYSGISLIKSIMNFFNLMIIVCIAILVIMVVLVIFLWFIFAPTIPLILVTIAVISATGSAGAVGGMGDAFCFAKNTKIGLKEGYISIKDIKIGDVLSDGSVVTATMEFNVDGSESLYTLDGVTVSGSHIVYKNGKPIFVKDHTDAQAFNGEIDKLYCLNTTSHKIPVLGNTSTLEFADWEELDDDSMWEWDSFVRNILNGRPDLKSTHFNSEVANSESGFSGKALVTTQTGYKKLSDLALGDVVSDGDGWTEVVGLVKLDSQEAAVFGSVNKTEMSGACWIKEDNVWIRAAESKYWKTGSPDNELISLFTDSGKILINGVVCVRDFSDIGINNIDISYHFTLSRLLSKVI
jgi:hypothetical protein